MLDYLFDSQAFVGFYPLSILLIFTNRTLQ
jgi:hypothetical protein